MVCVDFGRYRSKRIAYFSYLLFHFLLTFARAPCTAFIFRIFFISPFVFVKHCVCRMAGEREEGRGRGRGRGLGRGRGRGRGQGRGFSSSRGISFSRDRDVASRERPINNECAGSTLRQILGLLQCLSLRVEKIEQRGPVQKERPTSGQNAQPGPRRANSQNNGGSEQSSDRPTSGQRKQPGPPTTNSTNRMSESVDFADVVKGLYRSVQLQHHQGNWARGLPKAIGERLQRLIDDIKPPLPNDDIRRELKQAADRFAGEVCKLVRGHLDRKLQQTNANLETLDSTDADKAQQLATKYLTIRLGRRLQDGHRDGLLRNAVNLVGRGRSGHVNNQTNVDGSVQNSGRPINGHRKLPEPSTANRSTNVPSESVVDADGFQTPRGNKRRRARDSPTTPTMSVSNRFAALQETDERAEEDAEEPAVPTNSPKRPRKLMGSPRPGRKARQQHDVIVHDDKDDAQIKLHPSTTVLVLGDSNVRRFKDIPVGWEVHSIPGARFPHVTAALRRLDRAPKPTALTVIISAGINYRDDKGSGRCRDDLYDLADSIHDVTNTGFIINLVSFSAALSDRQKSQMTQVNQWIGEALKDYCTIPPLDPETVTIAPGDPYGVHYDDETAERLFANLVEIVTGLNAPSPPPCFYTSAAAAAGANSNSATTAFAPATAAAATAARPTSATAATTAAATAARPTSITKPATSAAAAAAARPSVSSCSTCSACSTCSTPSTSSSSTLSTPLNH